ncbi:MAG: RNA polymerase sigma factor [Phycisphaerales bacterium]
MELEARLIARVRSGDRDALAEFVRRYEPLIRARFREQFAGSSRGAFDTSDFFATVSRRADAALGNGAECGKESPGELLGRIIRDAALDCARAWHAEHRAQRAHRWRPPAAAGLEWTPADDDEQSVVSRLDATDGQIFRLRALGAEHGVVGHTLGMTESAVRMRWHRIIGRLQRFVRHA